MSARRALIMAFSLPDGAAAGGPSASRSCC